VNAGEKRGHCYILPKVLVGNGKGCGEVKNDQGVMEGASSEVVVWRRMSVARRCDIERVTLREVKQI
jgi:hypothetical protein